MAMTQVRSAPSETRYRKTATASPRSSPSKKRHLVLKHQEMAVDEQDTASINVSAAKPSPGKLAAITSEALSIAPIRDNSVLSQPPYATFGTQSPTSCSAIGTFLQHLKQSTSTESIEIVIDNPCGGCASNAPPVSSPKQQAYKKMSAAEKKNVRWDTHSSTYKVAAAAAAAKAMLKSEEASQDESYLQPLGGDESTTTIKRRSSAAAPTCPRRRNSREDCSMDDTTTEDGGDSSQDYKEELRKLRERIAQEEALLQSVAAAAGADKVDSPQKPERRSSLISLEDASDLSQVLLEAEAEDEVTPLKKDARQSRSLMELPSLDSPNKMTMTSQTDSLGQLPDYKMALNAVAQRYAAEPRRLGPGSLSSFRSASTGVLPSATATTGRRRALRSSNNDRPLGIPRRRESADIATLCDLDEATMLTESSPRAAMT